MRSLFSLTQLGDVNLPSQNTERLTGWLFLGFRISAKRAENDLVRHHPSPPGLGYTSTGHTLYAHNYLYGYYAALMGGTPLAETVNHLPEPTALAGPRFASPDFDLGGIEAVVGGPAGTCTLRKLVGWSASAY